MVKRINPQRINNGTITVAGGETFTSEVINLGRYINFGLMVENVTGTSPNFSIQYLVCSTVNGTYFAPNDNALIEANITGSVADMIAPVPSPFYKLQIINNTSNPVSLDLTLVYQED